MTEIQIDFDDIDIKILTIRSHPPSYTADLIRHITQSIAIRWRV